MITKDQALTLDTFHVPHVMQPPIGPGKCSIYRRSGQTQVWKTRPTDFRIPTKYGLYKHTQISHLDAHLIYAPNECPACLGTRH